MKMLYKPAMTSASPPNPSAPTVPRAFAHVETWVFDLDNTLYPHHLNLWQQVDDRIRSYIANFLGLTYDDAFRKQKDFYRRYGTTMRGMMIEHGQSAHSLPVNFGVLALIFVILAAIATRLYPTLAH